MILKKINKSIQADMQRVDSILRKSLDSDVPLVRQITEHIIKAGGKRLRPTVLLLVSGAFNYQGNSHHKLAAVVELIHTATLLHDDVVDESDLRRGNKTANVEFGNAASVLVGDFLYSQGFRLVIDIDAHEIMPVMRVLSSASTIIAEGEVMQLMNCHNAEISVEDYLEIIASKTAKLFEAAAQIGAIIANASAEVETHMAAYGRHLGIAFQLIDDALDYSGTESEIGKQLGDDLAEGKLTLPLIYALQQGSPEQIAIVRHAVEKGGRDEFNAVQAVISATGALEYTKAQAEKEVQKAVLALDVLRASSYKDSLLELAAFAVSRSF